VTGTWRTTAAADGLRGGARVASAAGIWTALTALMAVAPVGLEAQAFFFDAAVDQAFASDPLPSPLGFSVAVGRTSIVGPFGLHAGLLNLYEAGADNVPQHCTFASCTAGPFEQRYSMRIFYAGLSYDFRNPTDVYLNVSLNVGRNQQTEHLRHLQGGEDLDVGPGSQGTVGGSVDLRLRPFLGPFRPVFSGRYDRVMESECPADGTCAPSRDVWSVSVGLSWVAPTK
jgi:hypothetical protein